ncbi:type VI secretion system Vgr family protein [Paraburkholderia sp. EG287A]|uniref:type VI secretion system Vgr family protein n=1 Tax=Paraburkholderia sp. EG287A TaxID=3237012 RepID=UPI0034D2C3C6
MGAQDIISFMQSALFQTDRLVKLDSPAGANALLPQTVMGTSRLGRNFEYVIDAVSTNSSLELKSLIAQPVTLWLQRADKSYRPQHGYVHTARRLGADGELTSYQLGYSSWLHFLKFRKDAQIFQDKSVEAILESVFQMHPQAAGAFRFDIQNASPVRSFCVQYEDDWTFVHRLLESEGWFYYFEHADDGKSHTLVVTDDLYSLKAMSPQEVDFYRAGSSSQTEALVQWSGTRTLQSTSYSSRTFDYKNPGTTKETSFPTVANQGDLPEQAEVYEYTGAYSWQESDRGDKLTKLKLEEWESRAKRFFGVGGLRSIDVGRWFSLDNHPAHEQDDGEDRKFAVIEASWYIRNNIPVSETHAFPHSLSERLAAVRATYEQCAATFSVEDSVGDGSDGFFLVEVEAQRLKVPFRSPFEHHKPVMHLQSATVTGPENEEVYTDSLNRILVRMHWDRREASATTCWVRAAFSDTGSGYGSVHVPRIGEEVTIDWVGGDCDRPIATGRVYNGATRPHWHSNGILSGFRSREYGGAGGFNQLVMDDATAQNRLQLLSSQGNSMLHMGYLIAQDGNTRGSYLGSGFELRTDAYGALRANRGLFLSTHAAAGTNAQQLDVSAARGQLSGAGNLLESLNSASTTHQAESLQAGQDALKAFTAASTDSAQGQASGGRTAGGTGSANAFKEPILLAASPAGIGVSTQQSVHMSADEQLTLVSGQSTHIAAGKSLIASVSQRISLFVQNAGMKVFAARGKVEVQAHSDNIELTAQKTVKVLSTTEKVEVAAPNEILLTSGGAYIRISNGNIEIHAPGAIDVKGAQHAFDGPAQRDYPLPPLPTSNYDAAMQYLYHDNEPVQGARYIATLADGSAREGVLDSQGRMSLTDVPVGPVQVALGPDARTYARKDQTGNPDYKGEQLSEADIDSLINKHGGA